MSSTYSDWRSAYVKAAAGESDREARLIILEKEARAPDAQIIFRKMLSEAFDRLVQGGSAKEEASVKALEAAIRSIAGNAKLSFLLLNSDKPFSKTHTHVTGLYLSRFGTFGDIDSDLWAPAMLPVSAEEVFGPSKPSIWLTPDDVQQDPDDVAKDLGLPHFEGQVVFRMTLSVEGVDQFTPTCFDAGLFHAWQEVEAGHPGPCGLTRHLETGQRIHNELVVRSSELPAQDVSLVRLPPASSLVRVGRLSPDYLVGR